MISSTRPRNGLLTSASSSLVEQSQSFESQLILNQKQVNHTHDKDETERGSSTTTPMSLIPTKLILEDAENVSWNTFVKGSTITEHEARNSLSPETDSCHDTDTYLIEKLEEQKSNINEGLEFSIREIQGTKIDGFLVEHDLKSETALAKAKSQVKSEKNIKGLSIPCPKSKSNFLNSISSMTRKIAPQAAVRFSERMLKIKTKDDIVINRDLDPRIRGTLVHDFSALEQPGGNYGFPKVGSQDETSLSSISLDSMVSGVSLESSWSERNLTPISMDRTKEDVYINPDPSSRQNSVSSGLIISKLQNLHAEKKSSEICLNFFDAINDESFEKASLKIDENNTACDDRFLKQLNTVSGPPSKDHNKSDETGKKDIWELVTNERNFLNHLEPSSNAYNLESEKFSTSSHYLKEITHQDVKPEVGSRENAPENAHNTRKLNQYGDDSEIETYCRIFFDEEFKALKPEKNHESSESDCSGEKELVSTSDSIMQSSDNLHLREFQCKEFQSLNHDAETLESTKSLNAPHDSEKSYASKTKSQTLNDRQPCVIIPTQPFISPEIFQNNLLLDDFYFYDGNIAILQNYSSSSAFDETIFEKFNRSNRDQSIKKIASPSDISPSTRESNPFIPSSSSLTHLPIFKNPNSAFQQSDPPSNQLTNNLTEESLEAYQCALASAAFTAAANGKFCRDKIISSDPSLNKEFSQSGINKNTSEDVEESFLDDYEDDFDHEDKFQDCAIIAEANAEALAFDFDGFYGQEFGFYSAANNTDCESVSENGGVFGPVGLERKRSSQSGRFGSHEPNLTPITELSEHSNRNSFISPGIHSPSSVLDIMSWNSPSSRYDSER